MGIYPPPAALWASRAEVSARRRVGSCHRHSPPTPTSGCRGFESRHANAQQKAPYLSRYGAYLLFKGGRWGSNPRRPEPQSGALPLSYTHHCLVQRSVAGASIRILRRNASLKLKKVYFWLIKAPKTEQMGIFKSSIGSQIHHSKNNHFR